jgi:hypothetical protein
MFRIQIDTLNNSRIQKIDKAQLKKYIRLKLIEILYNNLLQSTAISKTNTVMYTFTYKNNV